VGGRFKKGGVGQKTGKRKGGVHSKTKETQRTGFVWGGLQPNVEEDHAKKLWQKARSDPKTERVRNWGFQATEGKQNCQKKK